MGLTNNLGRLSDALTADGSLNVGVGASPNASYKLDVTGAGRYQDNLLVSKNQNSSTRIEISNTTSGTSSLSQIQTISDATSGYLGVGKYSTTTTPYKIVAAKDGYLYNAIGGDIAILNDFATGTIKFAAGGSSTAQLTIAANGGITQSVSQNATTRTDIINTSTGNAAAAGILIGELAGSGKYGYIFHFNSGYTASGLYTPNTLMINCANTGGLTLLADSAAATIKFAAGASTSAHVTIGATGLTTFATGVDYKRLNPTTVTTASTATLTPDISAGDTFTITAQAASLSLANPTGTPVNGQKMIIRIKDNGTARAITFSGTQYRASSDLAFPTTTIVNKTLYMGFIWNSTDSKWDMLALLNNF